MEKHAATFSWWFLCALNDGAGTNEEDLEAWDELRKVLIKDERNKRLVIAIEETLETEGYRDYGQ